MDLSNTETVVAAVGAGAVWLWPYLLDLLAKADSSPEVKRVANKVMSWAAGLSVGGYSFDTIDDGTKELVVTAGSGLLAGLAARWGLEISHQATQGSAGRGAAQLWSLRGPSVEDLAPGDRLPIRTGLGLKLKERRAKASTPSQAEAVAALQQQIDDLSKSPPNNHN